MAALFAKDVAYLIPVYSKITGKQILFIRLSLHTRIKTRLPRSFAQLTSKQFRAFAYYRRARYFYCAVNRTGRKFVKKASKTRKCHQSATPLKIQLMWEPIFLSLGAVETSQKRTAI